ncbi:CheR family methyltransferase [Mangrovicoccus algicola]|uniref:Chemotaxis protein methyltransferase n=1 Tax=Mangrovicoccus algicola TaxID=2771008 RepID=A0A8J7D083_9RHOB|nr:protein-glutamate O-methyltransferase CheR [Mangrovicoccus algicola]MBE3639088.1 protein-glutamate O-methyltransferase CheR [Mangrovicoccus algicola]
MTHSQPPALTREQFTYISELAHREAGLVLSESKTSMIASRLNKRMKTLNIKNIKDYLSILKSDQLDSELPHLISSLTTNVSHFFREQHHYETFKKEVIPALKEKARSGEPIRIWSAGCSSGQEIYSLIFSMHNEFPDFEKHDIKFLATDIDPNIISFAKKAKYSKNQIKGIPENILLKHFDNEGDNYEVKENIRRIPTFRVLNLLKEWPFKLKFDVIFCRNVVIYFDENTQELLWQRFQRVIKKSGWIFIGHSERMNSPERFNFSPTGITTYRQSEFRESR